MLKLSLLFKKFTNFTGKYLENFSGYCFYMNTNIQEDLQICISVPLTDIPATKISLSISGKVCINSQEIIKRKYYHYLGDTKFCRYTLLLFYQSYFGWLFVVPKSLKGWRTLQRTFSRISTLKTEVATRGVRKTCARVSFEFCEIFKSTFFTERLRMIASLKRLLPPMNAHSCLLHV